MEITNNTMEDLKLAMSYFITDSVSESKENINIYSPSFLKSTPTEHEK